MDTKDLLKLVQGREILTDKLKELDAAHAEATAPAREKLKKIEAKLLAEMTSEDGLPQIRHKGIGRMAHLTTTDNYSISDGEALRDWVLEDPENRIDIFQAKVTSTVVKNYREETGAKEGDDGRLEGGNLPAGVGMFRKTSLRFKNI